MDIFMSMISWLLQITILVYFCMLLIASVLLWRYPHLFTGEAERHCILRNVYRYTAPLFASIRKICSCKLANGYDLSPLLALIGIFVLTLLLAPFFMAVSPLASLPV